MKSERFKQFNRIELELIRHGLRNCSLYDFQDQVEQATVFLLLEEISDSEIPFLPEKIRTLIDDLKRWEADKNLIPTPTSVP